MPPEECNDVNWAALKVDNFPTVQQFYRSYFHNAVCLQRFSLPVQDCEWRIPRQRGMQMLVVVGVLNLELCCDHLRLGHQGRMEQ